MNGAVVKKNILKDSSLSQGRSRIHRDMCASLGVNRMQRRTPYISYRESFGSYKYGGSSSGKRNKKVQPVVFSDIVFFSTKARITYDKNRKRHQKNKIKIASLTQAKSKFIFLLLPFFFMFIDSLLILSRPCSDHFYHIAIIISFIAAVAFVSV